MSGYPICFAARPAMFWKLSQRSCWRAYIAAERHESCFRGIENTLMATERGEKFMRCGGNGYGERLDIFKDSIMTSGPCLTR